MNGQYGGDFHYLPTEPRKMTYAYKRVKGEHEVLVILNLTDSSSEISLKGIKPAEYTNVFTGKTVTIGNEPISVGAHDHLLLEK